MRDLNPLFLPNDNIQPALFGNTYGRLIFRSHQIELINVRHARFEVHAHDQINNQTIEVYTDQLIE